MRNMLQYEDLARWAIPDNDADLGSDRQKLAELRFLGALAEDFPATFGSGSEFQRYCKESTPEEKVREALYILRTEIRLGQNGN